MFALFRALSHVIALFCSINVLMHARALLPLSRLGERKRALSYLAALPLAVINQYLMREAFTTEFIVCLHVSLILLAADALKLALRLFGRENRAYLAFRALTRRGLAFILAACVVAYGLYNVHAIRETRYEFATNKFTGELKIALIADTHLGNAMDADGFESLIARASERADMLVLAGDLTDEGTPREMFEKACAALAKLSLPAYFVYGNHDGSRYGGELSDAQIDQMLTRAGVNVLTDEVMLIDGYLRVAGRRDANERRRASPDTLLKGAARDEYIIMIDHQPAQVEEVARAGADLLLSGHTHNGQIWPISIISKLFRFNEIQYGHELIGGMHAVVTSGASGWGCAFRTSGASEYCIITITGEN